MQELTGSASKESKQHFWSMCQWKIAQSGWSKSRALATYKSKFGVFPKGLSDAPMRPDIVFEKRIKYELLKFLKGKGRQ